MNTLGGPFARPIVFCLALASLAACRDEEAPLSHDEIIRADLTEILELQGSACERVVKFAVDDRLDYRVECGSGQNYRIHVSAEGQVDVHKRPE